MSWSEREEDLVQEAVDLIWREHGRVNGTPCYEVALRMLQCSRAAEERGRRRGVEERDELRATIAELLPMAERAHHADLGKHLCPDVSSLPEGLRIAREGALLLRLHHPALAPRDSAPQHKDWCALFGNPEAGKSCDRRGALRDSGKEKP